MITLSMSLDEYLQEVSPQSVSPDDGLKRLAGGSETLKTRHWANADLQAIPAELVQFAFEHSEALQKEFGSFSVLSAYGQAHGAGWARIAVVRR